MRYIDEDKVIHAVCFGCNQEFSDKPCEPSMCSIRQAIKSIPTADVVEVRHGYWIERIEKPSWLEDDVEVYYDCSECGTSHWSITPPYCPECGAKMDGERKENDT